WVVAVALAGWGCFSTNPVLTPFCIMLLPLFASLLWFPGEPPAMLFAITMQWLQGSILIFSTNFYGVSMEEAFGWWHFATSTWLSLIGVLVLAVGMRLALLGRRTGVVMDTEREAQLIEPGKIFLI